jgi:hypothetical protein
MMAIRGYVPKAPWIEEMTVHIDCPGIPLLIFSGDWHLGHEGTDHRLLVEDIDVIASCPEDVTPIVFLMGDLIDNAIRSAPGTAIAETVIRVKEQKDEVLALCRKIGDKIVGVIQGNHEERSYREDDFEVSAWLANEVGVTYMGAGTKVNLELTGKDGKVTKLVLLVGHTYMGANPACKCRNFYNKRGPADVVALAHMHVPYVGTEYIQDKQRVFVQTGTYQIFSRFFMGDTLSSSNSEQPAVAIFGDKKMPFLDFKDAIKSLTGKTIEKVDNSAKIAEVEAQIAYIKEKLDGLKV